MTRSILLLLILCLGYGCGRQKSGNSDSSQVSLIDISKSEHVANRPALEIDHFVKLQTTENALLGPIGMIIPFDNYIFILTSVPQNDVFAFSADGSFLWKLMKGRANNEVLYPTGISIDETTRQLLVLDLYRNVKKFTLEGEYCGQESFQEPQMYVESVGEKGTMMLYNQMSKMNANNFHNAFVKEQDSPLAGVYRSRFRDDGPWGLGYLTKCNQDSVLLCPYFSDTIYLYSTRPGRLEPFLVFDFGGKSANIPAKLDEYKTSGEYSDATKSGLYTGPKQVHYLQGCLLANFNQKDTWMIYNTVDGELTAHDRMFDELPNYFGAGGQNSKYIVYPYEIYLLQEHFENHPPLSKTGQDIAAACANEEDNPILVFAKF